MYPSYTPFLISRPVYPRPKILSFLEEIRSKGFGVGSEKEATLVHKVISTSKSQINFQQFFFFFSGRLDITCDLIVFGPHIILTVSYFGSTLKVQLISVLY